MTVLNLGEAVGQSAIDYITSGTVSADKIAAVQARHADGYPLDDFQAVRMSDPMMEVESDFPVLYVVVERDVPEPGAGGLGRGFRLWTELFFVTVYELAADKSGIGISEAEVLRRQGLRYGGAVLEMLIEGRSTMGVEFGTGDVRTELFYGPVYTNKDRTQFVSSSYLRISAQTRETGS